LTALTQSIRGTGYWRICIRPANYVPQRVEYSSLAPILDRIRVSLQGWGFPHRGQSPSDTIHGDNWIGGEIDSKPRLQAWRFHQSGQFVLLRAIWTDHVKQDGRAFPYSRSWPPPQPVLPVADTVFTFTEAFEFASRLAMTGAGSDLMTLEFDLRGLTRRVLWVDDPTRSSMENEYRFDMPELSRRRDAPRSVLAGEAWDLAIEAALDVYARFGWNPPRQLVEGQQAGLRRS